MVNIVQRSDLLPLLFTAKMYWADFGDSRVLKEFTFTNASVSVSRLCLQDMDICLEI